MCKYYFSNSSKSLLRSAGDIKPEEMASCVSRVSVDEETDLDGLVSTLARGSAACALSMLGAETHRLVDFLLVCVRLFSFLLFLIFFNSDGELDQRHIILAGVVM